MNTFDAEKAVEAILYIAQKEPDLFHVLKAFFFADKYHLANYGRQITGDNFVAMSHGHVPSAIYDIIKFVRGDGYYDMDDSVKEAFKVTDHTTITPRRDPYLNYLSESDIEALENGIAQVHGRSFDELSEMCKNEPSYSEADSSGYIPLTAIVLSLENGEELFEYMTE